MSSSPMLSIPIAEAKSKWRYLGYVFDKIGPLLGLAVVYGIFAWLRPDTFPVWENFQFMLLQTAVIGTAALGATVIILSGGIDLSVGSSIALCSVVIAKLILAGYSPLWSALAGIGSSVACGLLIGLLVTGLSLDPFIVTLGLWGAIRGLAKGIANETEVGPPLTWLNDILVQLTPDQKMRIFPMGVWIMFLLTIFVSLVLRYTRFGRHVFAIGSNVQTARLCGVRVNRTKILIYVFAGFFAGIAGLLAFSRLTIGDATSTPAYELYVIASVVIGGTSLLGGQGGVYGTLIGALIMTMVANGCSKVDMPNWWQEIVTGGIIILAVVLDPGLDIDEQREGFERIIYHGVTENTETGEFSTVQRHFPLEENPGAMRRKSERNLLRDSVVQWSFYRKSLMAAETRSFRFAVSVSIVSCAMPICSSMAGSIVWLQAVRLKPSPFWQQRVSATFTMLTSWIELRFRLGGSGDGSLPLPGRVLGISRPRPAPGRPFDDRRRTYPFSIWQKSELAVATSLANGAEFFRPALQLDQNSRVMNHAGQKRLIGQRKPGAFGEFAGDQRDGNAVPPQIAGVGASVVQFDATEQLSKTRGHCKIFNRV